MNQPIVLYFISLTHNVGIKMWFIQQINPMNQYLGWCGALDETYFPFNRLKKEKNYNEVEYEERDEVGEDGIYTSFCSPTMLLQNKSVCPVKSDAWECSSKVILVARNELNWKKHDFMSKLNINYMQRDT